MLGIRKWNFNKSDSRVTPVAAMVGILSLSYSAAQGLLFPNVPGHRNCIGHCCGNMQLQHMVHRATSSS